MRTGCKKDRTDCDHTGPDGQASPVRPGSTDCRSVERRKLKPESTWGPDGWASPVGPGSTDCRSVERWKLKPKSTWGTDRDGMVEY
jgi:hypothetical protein